MSQYLKSVSTLLVCKPLGGVNQTLILVCVGLFYILWWSTYIFMMLDICIEKGWYTFNMYLDCAWFYGIYIFCISYLSISLRNCCIRTCHLNISIYFIWLGYRLMFIKSLTSQVAFVLTTTPFALFLFGCNM